MEKIGALSVSTILIVFLWFNVHFRHDGETNPLARYATLSAMVDRSTFTIDGYENLTVDWARTPDGHYYSNKPPGPAFLGLPFFWLWDAAFYGNISSLPLKIATRNREAKLILFMLSFLLQIVPAVALAWWGQSILRDRGQSFEARLFFLLAMLFGCTPALLLNTYFGHGMAALGLFASALCAYQRKVGWSAFCFGWSLLSDYSAALLLPGLVGMWSYAWPRDRYFLISKVCVGALLPAALWFWYHQICFGSPFSLPNKFQNPTFVDEPTGLWGIFLPWPSPSRLASLLFGTQRGLLWTQPWVLAAFPLGVGTVWKNRALLDMQGRFLFLAVSGLSLLLLMNAAFGGWHGGWTIGPRYLSPVLFIMAFATASIIDHCKKWLRSVLWTALMFTLCFYALAFSQTIIVVGSPWVELTELMVRKGPERILRVFGLGALLLSLKPILTKLEKTLPS